MPSQGRIAKRPQQRIASSYDLRSSQSRAPQRPGSPELGQDIARIPTPLSPSKRRGQPPALTTAPPTAVNHLAQRPESPSTTQLSNIKDSFSSTQLVFAARLCRSKPENLSWKEYFNCIGTNRRSSAPVLPSELLCFNNVEFLKNNCNQLFKENQAQRAEIVTLKSQLNASRQDLTRGCLQPTQNAPTGTALIQSIVQSHITVNADFETLIASNNAAERPKSCVPLLKTARVLYRQLSDQHIAPNDLQKSISATANKLRALVTTTSISCADRSMPEAQAKLRTFEAVYDICLQGVKHLCRDILGRTHSGKAVYTLVTIFREILQHSTKLCYDLAIEAVQAENSGDTVDGRGHTRKTDIPLPPALVAHTSFLSAVFYSKQFSYTPRPRCYTEILEGSAGLLSVKLGRLLSMTVFNEHVADSVLPGHIFQLSQHENPTRLTELATIIERSQMTMLLQTVGSRLSSISTDNSEEFNRYQFARMILGESGTSSNGENDGRMFRITKQRLQSTLCKAIFGDDEDVFLDAMNVEQWNNYEEESANQQLTVDMVDDGGGKFIEHLWDAVGWDIMAKK